MIWYFSFSDLLHLVWQPLGPSTLLQRELFHFLIAEKYPIVFTYHIFFIHSSVNGHLGCFHALPFVNSASINIGGCVLSDHAFSDICPAVGLQSYDDYVPFILMSVILFFTLFEKVEFKNINMFSTWAPILKFSLTLCIRHHFIFEFSKQVNIGEWFSWKQIPQKNISSWRENVSKI